MTDNGAPLILLTRPRPQSERFAAQIEGLAEIIIEPLQQIVPTGAVPPLDNIRGLIFTSENAVHLFGKTSQAPGLPTWCVGPRTTALASDLGLQAKAGGGDADALLATIMADAPPGPLLHLHGKHARGALAARLSAAGIETHGAEIYDQQALAPSRPLAPMAKCRKVIAPLFSPRSASLFVENLEEFSGNWQLLCLSQRVREALPLELRKHAKVAQAPTAAAMIDGLKRHFFP